MNRRRSLGVLAAVGRQRTDGEVELLVCDSGSTDAVYAHRRVRQPPDRSSARTRAAEARTRVRKAALRRASASSARKVRIHEPRPVVSTMSLPATMKRTAACSGVETARTAAASAESVTITPRKPSFRQTLGGALSWKAWRRKAAR